jgi:hypothetical protein
MLDFHFLSQIWGLWGVLLRYAFRQTQNYGANNRKMDLREQLNPTIVHSMYSVACTYQREQSRTAGDDLLNRYFLYHPKMSII